MINVLDTLILTQPDLCNTMINGICKKYVDPYLLGLPQVLERF